MIRHFRRLIIMKIHLKRHFCVVNFDVFYPQFFGPKAKCKVMIYDWKTCSGHFPPKNFWIPKHQSKVKILKTELDLVQKCSNFWRVWCTFSHFRIKFLNVRQYCKKSKYTEENHEVSSPKSSDSVTNNNKKIISNESN